jgi:hypothetical protein
MKNRSGTNNVTDGPTWHFDAPLSTVIPGESPAEMLGRAATLHQGGQL